MTEITKQSQLRAGDVARAYPMVRNAYAALCKACAEAGPIEGQALRLVKPALAIGVDSEGVVHSHTRQAVDEGIAGDVRRHTALLAIPTLAFPQAVKALRWIEDVIAA